MSVAAIGTSVQRVGGNSASTMQQRMMDARPNTGQTGASMYNNIFRGMPGSQQKLPVSKIPDIVQRMQRETKSSSAKRGKWYKSDSYIDPRTYSWKNLALFSDYQAHMWTDNGGIKSAYKK
ncbi:uncharacterized protein LOC132741981 [Ruditapes philippinarum]|uniref:uncharacterized protein LOC132741981 n=1 Tax=Ruditapes philippinarum TaxID=129788 RepID=UPI00295AD413|nr:uncharacterized protein LOC132741981 [Ruditapes philippinarum]